jgi:hypothetical protein
MVNIKYNFFNRSCNDREINMSLILYCGKDCFVNEINEKCIESCEVLGSYSPNAHGIYDIFLFYFIFFFLILRSVCSFRWRMFSTNPK